MCNGILLVEGREAFRVELDSNYKILEMNKIADEPFELDEAKILREQIWEDEVAESLLEEMVFDEVLK